MTAILRDEFTTTQAAPLTSPRTCEPGPGTLTIVDTGNKLSISGERLAAAAGTAISDPRFASATLTRQCGLAALMQVEFNTTAANGMQFGWGDSTEVVLHALQVTSGQWRIRGNASVQFADAATLNTPYRIAIVLRTAGAFYFLKGGVFTNWTLVWVDLSGSTAGFVGYSSGATNTPFVLDGLRVVDLASIDTRFASDNAFATSLLSGSVSPGQTFTHAANCVLGWTIAALGPSANIVTFRRQDSSNYWRADVGASGQFELYEVIAGAVNYRAGTGTGIVTAGHRVVVTADGTTIRGYSNNILRWTYSSAANFQNSTAGSLFGTTRSGNVSDLVAWPRTVVLPSDDLMLHNPGLFGSRLFRRTR